MRCMGGTLSLSYKLITVAQNLEISIHKNRFRYTLIEKTIKDKVLKLCRYVLLMILCSFMQGFIMGNFVPKIQ